MSGGRILSAQDVHDIMGAGHETTASTAAAALWAIAAHPQAEARVHAELDAVLGSHTLWLCRMMPWLCARSQTLHREQVGTFKCMLPRALAWALAVSQV